jgi:iron complex transport system substrate-binding protein
MRIASLLPSATEIVCALGARDELVGRSHECDFPPGIEAVPVLTHARIGAQPTSRAIDRAVRDVIREVLAIYEIDVDRLREQAPEVIVTQDLCDVCAVSFEDVRSAVARLARDDVRIVNLHPTKLADVWSDILRVASAIGRAQAGEDGVARMLQRVDEIGRRASKTARRPSVLSVEWIDPVMIGGMWMPELIALAGGTPMITAPGDHAPTLDRARLEGIDPDVVVVKPCGFDLHRTLAEEATIRSMLPRSWRAVRDGRVYACDGNAFFNRPGPRLVDSLEILAACIHPEELGDLGERHRRSYARVLPDRGVE